MIDRAIGALQQRRDRLDRGVILCDCAVFRNAGRVR
jgi:hypothetical protein